MRFTAWALAGLFGGTLAMLALYLQQGPVRPEAMRYLSWTLNIGALAGAWCGSLLGLHSVLEQDERMIATEGCLPIMLAMGLSCVPLSVTRQPYCELSFLLGPLLTLGMAASGARTHVSPLLALGMAAWLAVMLGVTVWEHNASPSQYALPLVGLAGIVLGASAIRSRLRWKLPRLS